MAREILFKAKRIDNGEWVEGLLSILNKGNISDEGILETESVLAIQRPLFGMIEIDPNTICQYTGLCDKNGNKIWENDVVRKTDTNPLGWRRVRECKVSFNKRGYWLLTTTYGDGYWICEFESEQLEVIGNIFDNPELLGGADNG